MPRLARETPNHELVLDALRQAPGPVTAYELLARLKSAGITAPVTIYRALERLIRLGLAHRVETRNAYVACRHTHQHGYGAVFTLCDGCGEVHEFTEDALVQALARRITASGYRVDDVVIEFRGRCPDCAGEFRVERS